MQPCTFFELKCSFFWMKHEKEYASSMTLLDPCGQYLIQLRCGVRVNIFIPGFMIVSDHPCHIWLQLRTVLRD